MRIGDILVVISTPVKYEDKYLGVFYNALVKSIRAPFSNCVNVSMFLNEGVVPQKHTFEKGKSTKIHEMTPNSVFRIADIDIDGRVKKDKAVTFIRVRCVPNEHKFFDRYIKEALARNEEGVEFDEEMGWKNTDNDGNVTVRPFLFWKIIKKIYSNRRAMPAWEENLVLEDILADHLKELEKKDEQIKLLEKQALVAGHINIFHKNGKIKKRYLKDLEG